MSMYFDKKCQNTCQMSIDVLNDEKIGEKQVAAGGPKNEKIWVTFLSICEWFWHVCDCQYCQRER